MKTIKIFFTMITITLFTLLTDFSAYAAVTNTCAITYDVGTNKMIYSSTTHVSDPRPVEETVAVANIYLNSTMIDQILDRNYGGLSAYATGYFPYPDPPYNYTPPDGTYYVSSTGAYYVPEINATYYDSSSALYIKSTPEATSNVSLVVNSHNKSKSQQLADFVLKKDQYIASTFNIKLDGYRKVDVFKDETIENRKNLCQFFINIPQIGDSLPSVYLEINNAKKGIILCQTSTGVNKLYHIELISLGDWVIKSIQSVKGTLMKFE